MNLRIPVNVSDRLHMLTSRLHRMAKRHYVRLSGEALIIVRDARTRRVIRRQKAKNVITNAALNLFASLLADPFSNTHVPEGQQCPVRNSWQLRLGTGSGTPSASDTDLFSPVSASYKSGSVSASGNSTQYYVRYMPEDANGYTYTEAGIFENNAETMINHIMLSPELTKDSSILVDFYVTITFS